MNGAGQRPSWDGKDLVIGLDVSTSIVGVAILTIDGDLIALEHMDLRKAKGWEKVDGVRRGLDLLKMQYGHLGFSAHSGGACGNICKVFIEQNLSGFRPGLSSAQTLLTLARFNGIVSLIARDVFHVDPLYVNFTKARKVLGIKTQSKKKCGRDVKVQLWEYISKMIDWDWKYRVLKSGPRKGMKILCNTQYDCVDAYITARAGLMGVREK